MLLEGLRAGEELLQAQGPYPGRFSQEEDLLLHRRGGQYLLAMKLYYGRRHYLAWVELYNIAEGFFRSPLEGTLLGLLAASLGPGEALHVEYGQDGETREALILGAPAACTRLGHLLWGLGFSWFKDYYIAEGFREGGQKLQAEKPLDGRALSRHRQALRAELEAFLRKPPPENPSLRGARARATKLLQELRHPA